MSSSRVLWVWCQRVVADHKNPQQEAAQHFNDAPSDPADLLSFRKQWPACNESAAFQHNHKDIDGAYVSMFSPFFLFFMTGTFLDFLLARTLLAAQKDLLAGLSC